MAKLEIENVTLNIVPVLHANLINSTLKGSLNYEFLNTNAK